MPIKPDHLGKHFTGEKWRPSGFLFENDLQQDTACEVLTALCVFNHDPIARQNQLFNITKGDVTTCLSIVKATIGILLNQSSCLHTYSSRLQTVSNAGVRTEDSHEVRITTPSTYAYLRKIVANPSTHVQATIQRKVCAGCKTTLIAGNPCND